MSDNTQIGHKLMVTIKDVKGHCNAGHKPGDNFELDCYNSGGLCGFCYHDNFHIISTMQFGGKYPWWSGDTVEIQCPDHYNLVTFEIKKVK